MSAFSRRVLRILLAAAAVSAPATAHGAMFDSAEQGAGGGGRASGDARGGAGAEAEDAVIVVTGVAIREWAGRTQSRIERYIK